jgi:hypothetical protein
MTTTAWEKLSRIKTEQLSIWVRYCQSVQRKGIKPMSEQRGQDRDWKADEKE